MPPREGAARSRVRSLAAREGFRVAGARPPAIRGGRSRPRRASTPARLARVNALLRSAERTLTRDEGLPRRPWFKHFVYAPGFYTGYDVKTLPAVREAIEEKQYADVNANAKKTAESIEKLAVRVRAAAAAPEARD